MGLKTSTSQAIWISLSRGEFIVKDGERKVAYPCFDGLLVNVEFVDKQHQGKDYREMQLSFSDDGQIYKLGLRVGSGAWNQTVMKLPNCEISVPIEFSPTYEEATSSKTARSGMFLNQTGSTIKQFWNKDNPRDLPPAVQDSRGWDFSEQVQYLETYMLEVILPKAKENAERMKLSEKSEGVPGGLRSHSEPEVDESFGDGEADIPF